MVKRNSEHVLTKKNLQKEDMLNRAINLLHHKRQGQQEVIGVLGGHISYDAFSENLKPGARIERDIVSKKASKQRLKQKK